MVNWLKSGTKQEIKTKNVLKSRKYYHLYVNVLIVHNKYYFCPSDKWDLLSTEWEIPFKYHLLSYKYFSTVNV